ncbi:flagellar basal body-associated protein FliL [Methylobacterium brachythecii]|uniref:Flagellar protein FliL n=1 Tax=Methylobacterium brachythecii TaxID=1176177 RepID=A0A7W6AEF8_9HYPH|nr:flagellar basal body-associated protein FliL [Methylobacterium brachythecii]MBB3901780.1 flagellar FliL protein [Methylobacterium brachythecii]GLS47078.1 flagellar FliL protein [Methylobacterium brachythecii]
MAKKPKKAPEGEDGAAAEAPKSKKKLIIIAAAAAVLLLGGGGGGYFMMKKPAAASGEQADAHGAPAAEGGGGHGAAAPKMAVAFLEVRDLIVNLTPEPGQSKGGYLKLKVALELKNGLVEAEVKPLLPRVEDTFQTYMRELRASDIAGSAGLYRLREELLRRVNVAIHPAKAEAVLFKDVVVQ